MMESMMESMMATLILMPTPHCKGRRSTSPETLGLGKLKAPSLRLFSDCADYQDADILRFNTHTMFTLPLPYVAVCVAGAGTNAGMPGACKHH
jgi:hypothetical protein